ncbi:MAG: hypothetical protein ONB44_21960 [candidate division KSB1 bacterium]|nr:hypothetical protein [candidate division KSB1 bacterium]MDZ7304802.1 hypothetical protein [candidate division KSB1 bacterium]MDZ7313852.1 hypothetical protein [candidate division KSB1 bacterium]
MKNFIRRTIHYFIFITISLFGITYELVKSEVVRWPLIGGYAIVIGASIYGIRKRFHEQDADAEQTND